MYRGDLADDFPTIIEKSVVWYDDQHREYRCSYVIHDMVEHTELRENFEPLSIMLFHMRDMKSIQKHVSKWPPCAIEKLIQCHRERDKAQYAIEQSTRVHDALKKEPTIQVMRSVPARVKQPKRIKPPARPAPSRPPKVKKKVIPAPPKVAFILRECVVGLAKELKMTYLEAHEEFGNLSDKDILALHHEMKDFAPTTTNGRFSL